MDDRAFLSNLQRIFAAARASDDGSRCAVSMSPEARERMKVALERVRSDAALPSSLALRLGEPKTLGFNDGVIIPPEEFPLGTSPSVIRSAAADRAPLRGTLRVIVLLIDFADKPMAQTQQHFVDLFFGQGGAAKSVREYYAEVTNGLIDIQGDVVGPFRMPQTIAAYANGASGIGNAAPNAQTMARDALLAANPTVNFTPYDNDGNGFVDAFVVVHAGTGAETNASPNDIWSHKWTIEGGAMTVDATKVFAYLTVPEDCRIGVCAHELGHLLFGFPDLYDTDNSSEGIGNWCLMASGSWGGGGDAPTHPSAWCKANQGWAAVDNRTANGIVSIADVKTSQTVYRLWKDGAPGKEYFLVENRQRDGDFDISLPGSGLLVWHIDENQTNNRDENHYWVALMQADGKRDLELSNNRGDAGDAFPGTSNNTNFTATSTPNSKSYAGASTCVAVTGISAPGPTMTANLQCQCQIVKIPKEFVKEAKEFRAEKSVSLDKRFFEKRFDKRLEKPVTDKSVGRDKGFAENKFSDNKFGEGKLGDGLPGGGAFGFGHSVASAEGMLEVLSARVAALEEAIGGGSQGMGERRSQGSGQGPFIGNELRPDLSQGALSEENDLAELQQAMASGAPQAKRSYDTKQG